MLTSTVAILHDNAVHGEDAYLMRTLDGHTVLDAVMDGVTGRQGGEASQAVRAALATASLTSPDDVVAVLEDVNGRLYRRGWGPLRLTTVSIALCLHDTLHVMSAGDSSALLIRSTRAQPLIDRSHGVGPTGALSLIGASQTLRYLSHVQVSLLPGDRVVLATDGVTDNLAPDKIAEMVCNAASPEAAVACLRAGIATRQAVESVTARLREPFRSDDCTAIVRFFYAPH
jgi:serine/threonine protein phosphatase PrpC